MAVRIGDMKRAVSVEAFIRNARSGIRGRIVFENAGRNENAPNDKRDYDNGKNVEEPAPSEQRPASDFRIFRFGVIQQ